MTEKSHDNKLTENEQTFLGILFSVEQYPKDFETGEYLIEDNQRVRLNEEGIQTISKRRLGDQVTEIPSLIKSLISRDMITKSNSIYELTEIGREIGKKVKSIWSSELYDDLLLRCANSQAYAQFCERVYGLNLLQFNVIDMEQLELLQDNMNLVVDDVVLDLGCGLGKITEYIAQKTGSRITGIDSSEKAIKWAQNNTKSNEKLNFEVVDINELHYTSGSFDAIIALDVLYWIDDLEPVVKKLKSILKPNGRMGIFYVLFRTENDPVESLLLESSKLGKLFEKYDFKYELIDIGQNAVDLWKQKISIGEELRSQFDKESNLDIIDSRIAGGKNVISNFENELQKRYFIFVENKE